MSPTAGLASGDLDHFSPYPDKNLVPSPRLRWYNPMLNPQVQTTRMTKAMKAAVRDGTYDDGTAALGGPLHEPDFAHPFNLVSSLCEDGLHRPALDIDMPRDNAADRVSAVFDVDPTMVEWVRSTSNWHAYLWSVSLSWPDYVYLLIRCDREGLLETGYVKASINRGQTLLRPPHIRKGAVAGEEHQ